MTMYITHFVIIPLRVNNVVFGNACFSDNILLNCESMVRTQKLSEETFFYCAVSSMFNVQCFCRKELYHAIRFHTATVNPSSQIKSIKSFI